MTLLAITGSTGRVGRPVAAALAARAAADEDLQVRLVVRDAGRAPALPGVEVAVAEYADADAARNALAGADAVFMVSAHESPTRRAEHRQFIQSAVDVGVEHLVYTSFVGAAADCVFTLGRDHWDTEQWIAASGLTATVLRDNFYADELARFGGPDGVIRGPAGEGRVAAVARADVADVAIAVLTDLTAHAGASYELTGPEAFTLAELAERAGRVLGQPLRFENETVAQAYASRARYGAEPWQLNAWVSTYLSIAAGEVAAVSGDVERLTGHPARSLEEALAGH